jgi:hypothetical protein
MANGLDQLINIGESNFKKATDPGTQDGYVRRWRSAIQAVTDPMNPNRTAPSDVPNQVARLNEGNQFLRNMQDRGQFDQIILPADSTLVPENRVPPWMQQPTQSGSSLFGNNPSTALPPSTLDPFNPQQQNSPLFEPQWLNNSNTASNPNSLFDPMNIQFPKAKDGNAPLDNVSPLTPQQQRIKDQVDAYWADPLNNLLPNWQDSTKAFGVEPSIDFPPGYEGQMNANRPPPSKLDAAEIQNLKAQYPDLAAAIDKNASFAALINSNPTLASRLEYMVQLGGRIGFSDKGSGVLNMQKQKDNLQLSFGNDFRVIPSTRNPDVLSEAQLNDLSIEIHGAIDRWAGPVADPKLAEFAVRVDLYNHLTRGEGAVKGELSGGHNESVFLNNLSQANGRVVSVKQSPTHPAIQEFTYQLPKIDPATGQQLVAGGVPQWYPPEQKTVYADGGQHGISDAQMVEYAQYAADQAMGGSTKQQVITINTPSGPIDFNVYADSINSLTSQVNKEFTNVHPIIP